MGPTASSQTIIKSSKKKVKNLTPAFITLICDNSSKNKQNGACDS